VTALGNPGIVTISTAYRTSSPLIPAAVSTNGFILGPAMALGSAAPGAPTFDSVAIAAIAESVDSDGKVTFNLMITGTLEQDFLDKIFFEFADTQYNLYTGDAAFSTTLVVGYSMWSWTLSGTLLGTTAQDLTVTLEDLTDDFNCDCTTGIIAGTVATQFGLATLGALRRRMMIRLGYAAQADKLPPGMKDFCNEYLSDAQIQIEKKFKALNMQRFFRWTMQRGQRYYGLDKSEGGCAALLDPYQITWVGFEDLNRAWYELIEGIPPVYYTRANINFGWPARYEIRQCIEIFPAPQAPYTLWIKGQFGLSPFVTGQTDEDTNLTTFDSELVFLLALANAKASKGQVDAQAVMSQATTYLGALVAGSHGTTRYVPKSKTQNPATPPRFLPLGLDQA
jgi:hypothetical protein